MTSATTQASNRRADTVAVLRAVADLLESQPGIPAPGCDISFYVHGDDTPAGAPATVAAIARALPCGRCWQASIGRSSAYEWLNLTSGPSLALDGTRVRINAPAAAVCTASGAKTVTVWQPAAPLTGLLGSGALGGEA